MLGDNGRETPVSLNYRKGKDDETEESTELPFVVCVLVDRSAGFQQYAGRGGCHSVH